MHKHNISKRLLKLKPISELKADGFMSSQTIAKPIVVRRFFFVCTGGKLFNGMMSFNTFDLKTDDGKYPTVKDCVDSSIQKHIGQTGIMLLSISEIPANDWEHFVSAQ